MKRIDAHQHFWTLATRDGAWPPPELTPIHRDFGPIDLGPHLTANDVAGTVLVQSLPTIADTHFMLGLAEKHAFVKGVVGWVDLKSAQAPADIALLADNRYLKGLRPMLQDLESDWILDDAVTPAVRAMLDHGLSFDALVLPRHLKALYTFARRHPGLPVCIDHGAKPEIASGATGDWKDDIAALAALPQVVCKLSGLVTEAGTAWQRPDLVPYARHILDCFGPRRVLWGSDWPVLNLASDYDEWIDICGGILSGLDVEQQADVWGRNAMRFYRLDVDL
jgi:L-fuconolactonase